ncbi:MAG: hypothetical protein HDR04_16775 [Lachnospiraceae bacterium]|nr:hypothetical protein [Lachnospiraceae bacterium]
MKLPTAYDIVLTPAKEERLSQIIREINSRTGKQYDNDVAINVALQIWDIMIYVYWDVGEGIVEQE